MDTETIEWPPKVWHGVVDPKTGEKIPAVKYGDGSVWNGSGESYNAMELPEWK